MIAARSDWFRGNFWYATMAPDSGIAGQMKSLPNEVLNQLQFYVYLYVNPINDSVFYVGKGKGNRAFAHLNDTTESAKVALIREIRSAGMEPKIEILVHGLKTEEMALKIEAAVIDLIGKANLTNKVAGYHSRSHGRMTLAQVHALYQSEEAKISEPSLLIRINQLYRYTMSPIELYDATRGIWKAGLNRDKVDFAMAVYEGVIREVYGIAQWLPAGSTFSTRSMESDRLPGRWEFVGRVADDAVRGKYLYKSVRHYFGSSSQNPLLYVNV